MIYTLLQRRKCLFTMFRGSGTILKELCEKKNDEDEEICTQKMDDLN